MNASTAHHVDADTIDCLIDSAGYMIAYWAESAIEQDDGSWQYTVQDGLGCKQEGKTYTLDQKAVERGLKVLATQYKHLYADIITGRHDAATGDCFVQACIFGDIIFG